MGMSRREFSKLGAMGLAARMLPQAGVTAPSGGRKIGYCVIGLGTIADHFMRGVLASDNSKITGLVSGHRDKAERIAEQYGVPKSSIYNYENMDHFSENTTIDAVYVALPNSMHAEYTIRSAAAGKHVFCEKPMCTTVSEGEAMIAACRKTRVQLMIAYRLHYEPLHLKAVKLIKDGALGEVGTINGAFGFIAKKGEWRLNKALAGGGSLYDVGIYVLNASRYLTGEEPVGFTAETSTVHKDGRFDSVEENVSWTTRFPSGAVATGSCTYGTQMPGYFKVFASKGWISMDPAFNYDGLRLRARYSSGVAGTPDIEIDESNPEKDPAQFTRETSYFSDCIRQDQKPRSSGEEGLRDIKYIRQIYDSA